VWVFKQNNKKKKKVGARSLIRSTSGLGGHVEFRDGTRINSQIFVQDEINLHNQKKKAINAS
jgi:UDP-3-O-[3-hydroxymyristoyl] glucosamine N-acyltransferase